MSAQRPNGAWGRARWRTVVVGCAVMTAVALVSCGLVSDAEDPPPVPRVTTTPRAVPTTACTVSALLVPSCGAWFGVAANPLGDESWDEALPAFEKVLGRPVDIAHYYNSSPKLFPAEDMVRRAREPGKKRLLLLNWKPEMGRTWAEVAAGDPEVDAAIDAQAQYLRTTFPERFFLTIHHEPEEEVEPAAGSGFTAKDYAAMYRRVALRLKAKGVTNAVLVMTYRGAPHWGAQPWFEDLYPGDDVVDWIAEDPYIFGPDPEYSGGIGQAVNRTQRKYPQWPGFYTWATTKHPGKPIMLAEWGVSRNLGEVTRSAVFATMPDQLAAYPQVKALVYWHETDFGDIGATRLKAGDPSVSALRTALQSPRLKPPAVPN
ncbi:hypothetical protein Kfla_2725 [Kribbella flavida DSM 17836]|uniref:GH26 domain-containing protein n=1 Tax=Kribbella flavida (strain DSM 17836 / JCM 10339 / NBRC 14399) TaxID=479435 RepID=D2PYZ6_KRIFD|nr:hypothetical protein [Kribbella flavida]ADB31790.1 hypothetical protein Kfla_2725 [Kribbella flavida DSM 17836]